MGILNTKPILNWSGCSYSRNVLIKNKTDKLIYYPSNHVYKNKTKKNVKAKIRGSDKNVDPDNGW